MREFLLQGSQKAGGELVEPGEGVMGGELVVTWLKGPAVPIVKPGELEEGGKRLGRVAFGDGEAGAVGFDPVADALSFRGQARDPEVGCLSEGVAAAVEVFIGGPCDVEGGEDGVEIAFEGDAPGGWVEVEVVDFLPLEFFDGGVDV